MTAKLVVANWKMHGTPSETESLLMEILSTRAGGPDGGARTGTVETVIAPPFTSLPLASRLLAGTGIALGAQSCHWEEEGAFTGDISPKMLAECGCTYVILGHSERREHAAETDRQVSRKAVSALFWGLTPILCVGEKRDERDSGRAGIVVRAQVERCLEDVALDPGRRLVIAYEPIWAIGSGDQPTGEEIRDIHRTIRAEMTGILGEPSGGNVPILYGGSVTPFNVASILALDGVDGVLVGGASLEPATFLDILSRAGDPGSPAPG